MEERDSSFYWEPGEYISRSPCHNAPLYQWSWDGRSAGACTECHATVIRLNRQGNHWEVPIKMDKPEFMRLHVETTGDIMAFNGVVMGRLTLCYSDTVLDVTDPKSGCIVIRFPRGLVKSVSIEPIEGRPLVPVYDPESGWVPGTI